jgi:hypothetical protein
MLDASILQDPKSAIYWSWIRRERMLTLLVPRAKDVFAGRQRADVIPGCENHAGRSYRQISGRLHSHRALTAGWFIAVNANCLNPCESRESAMRQSAETYFNYTCCATILFSNRSALIVPSLISYHGLGICPFLLQRVFPTSL